MSVAFDERAPLRLVEPGRHRVVDVALFYGERSGGIRTYLNAKVAYAQRTGAFEHRLVVPGTQRDVSGPTCALPSVRVAPNNGYRWPLGIRPLADLLVELEPDFVLLHDPFWAPRAAVTAARSVGARVVMVHHGSLDLDVNAIPGPNRLYRPALGAWMRRAYGHVDAVMAACDPLGDTGREATLPLRFGLDPAFFPSGGTERGDHVLYAGRLSREKGVFELLEAAARSSEPWPLWLMGTGTAENAIAARARKLGVADRVRMVGYESDREALARAYESARCVVMPGELETFGLVAFEAAASGASVVACTSAPSARVVGPLAETFAPGDIEGLAAAIERARAGVPDRLAAARFASAHRWEHAFAAELADLEAL
ncbi:glycosyltransferase [Solirubrobacter sp. CPCC 204708]|uniref:Glycosyltransferase n=1 Tax=Solirubrobacter deserti TaxID=2282478 RepID=A0ABT4RQV9_9ACTN|nr:glycosyltransferase [Solirubrobacter deserti]MBE2320095.1 glycosyltransferase [Solirubrobacter deserti]MDA0140966.1 glycosyltransferase [Solirubrobacter deserti]